MAKRTNAGGVTKGSWTELEDNVLRSEVRLRGDDELCNGWAEIAERIPGRTAKQCRERWVQNLKPSLDRGPITPVESDFILKEVSIRGTKWAEIARQLRVHGISNRSDNAVKNWFNGNKNRMKRSMNRQMRDSNDISPSFAAARLPRRASMNPASATLSVASLPVDYSPSQSPTTPYAHTHHYSRPASQQSTGYHRRRQSSFAHYHGASPRQLALPPPMASFGSSRYLEERRGSTFTVANSPASDATMPPLEADTGSPLIPTHQHSPALSHAAGPEAYSLTLSWDEQAPFMKRTSSEMSSMSQPRHYSELLEPAMTLPGPPSFQKAFSLATIMN